jgi:hypothetical protein
MEYLDHIVSQTYGSILIGCWKQKLFGNFDHISGFAPLKDSMVTDADEISESRCTIKQQKHVVRLVNILKKAREEVHDL